MNEVVDSQPQTSTLQPIDQLRAKIAELELDKESLYRQIESIDLRVGKLRKKIDLVVMLGNSTDSEELISSIINSDSCVSSLVDSRIPAKDDIQMSSPGQPGQIAFDSKFLYVCIDNSTWRRCPLVMWAAK